MATQPSPMLSLWRLRIGNSTTAVVMFASPVRAKREHGATLARVSVVTAVAVGAVLGLLLGIVVSVASDLPLAPEVGSC